MTETDNTLLSLKESTEEEKMEHRYQFHLLEDEQISIQNLINKLNGWLNTEKK